MFWTIIVDCDNGQQKTFGGSGPRTAAAMRAEFERQQNETDKDGIPLMPKGKIVSVKPRDPKKPRPNTPISGVTDLDGNPIQTLGDLAKLGQPVAQAARPPEQQSAEQ